MSSYHAQCAQTSSDVVGRLPLVVKDATGVANVTAARVSQDWVPDKAAAP